MGKGMKKQSTEEYNQMEKGHMKKYSTSLAIEEYESKPS